MKITISDVALKAGVSVATVSRVVNNQVGYSEKTKEKVLKVIEELNYTPNAIARGLASNSSSTIGVLVPYIPTNIVSTIIKGLETSASDKGYSIIISNTGIDGERTGKCLGLMSEKRVDGIIIVSEPIHDEYYKILELMNIPAILVSTLSYKYEVPFVKVNDEKAAYDAVQYLISKNHRNIAMISGCEDDLIAGKPRLEGYINALTENNININKRLIKYGDFSYKSGKTCMEELISQERNNFTAVFAASDDMAIGALKAAYYNNIKVPEDVSIMGYDNTQISEMVTPALTVISQPFEEMGKVAASNLIKIIEKSNVVKNTILKHEIIERESVEKLI
ncbi:LacI family DNA-binding transcriptional regulator [Clostridium grantii]|uniref:Transcriptional regulator, LacI family n=1 Tax=Clostridium grantii DSM 8605 TaxID=1121316 RepID=A0A1M5UYC8_9CLOT|nr:LacI family DNA-binding transcriptional regulator [Clostridium grantii]SHH68001.1 transcriptional regulator, LacI family [Clostridium grantii DSM 8605]